MSDEQHRAATAQDRNPWAAPPQMLDGPGYLPRTPHQEALDAAVASREPHRRMQLQRSMEAEARYQYEHHQQQVELTALQRRRARLEDRMAMNRPQLRDGAVGSVTVLGVGTMLMSNAQVQGTQRLALLVGLGGLSLFAGSQWMEWRCEQRTARYEDELDRVEERIAQKSVPRPRPFDAWGVDIR